MLKRKPRPNIFMIISNEYRAKKIFSTSSYSGVVPIYRGSSMPSVTELTKMIRIVEYSNTLFLMMARAAKLM